MLQKGTRLGLMNSIQEMLIEKYLFTKAPAGPYHNPEWSCIDCEKKLDGYYDFYPYCISCRENHHTDLGKFKEWLVKQKGLI